jgi:hypothetical protein
MKTTVASASLGFLLLGVVAVECAAAQTTRPVTILRDNFEAGRFAREWDRIDDGVSIRSVEGASGTDHYAALSAGQHLGARFDRIAEGGAQDFQVDCHFRIHPTTDRQFNLHLSTSTGGVGGSTTVNLRYHDGWAAYNGAWQPIPSLGAITPGEWFHLRVSGRDWGLPGARYAIELSDAGGGTFTSAADELTWFQNGNATTQTARYFSFASQYGNSPGFDVDEVVAEVTASPPAPPPPPPDAILNISGTYPHLAVFSNEGEIGIGGVVPWADRLWFVTYPPHKPNGSADKLWMIDTNLTLRAHPASVGCTDANRFIHRESQQLNIGHYWIDAAGNVRAIAPSIMPGRLTGTARHLSDPANRVYIATMEEGLYDVDVRTLEVRQILEDMNSGGPTGDRANLPGQHGKGLYSSQGRLVYSNNGVGGSLSSWDGDEWTVVEREKFTEVTGPGGIYGNTPDDDRLWATGWDTRSVILKLLQDGEWHTYRLPKGSYTHDADHGWFTEWPRIREVRPGMLLMHMHGLFHRFPKTFAADTTGGINPICTYLKMPVDYCSWNGQLVMGRDDASTTGGNKWAGQSHSAPWFGQLEDLENWGPPAGFGGVWYHDTVTALQPSDPFLLSGFQRRLLHLKQNGGGSLDITLEYDADGTGNWQTWTHLTLAANGYTWQALPASLQATWVRLVPRADAADVTAYFHLGNPPREAEPSLFGGIADVNTDRPWSGGILRPRSGDARTLEFAASRCDGNGELVEQAFYEINGAFELGRVTDATAEATLRKSYGLGTAEFTVDEASVLVTEGTNRFRLPPGDEAYHTAWASGWPRGKREVVTERDLFQACGTFYELPKPASGGFRRIRPITMHNKRITDFASWRGLFAVAGTLGDAASDGHYFKSTDGLVALWFGNVDDLWRMGAPRGVGGPWSETAVRAGVPSDPYLMFGYEAKALELANTGGSTVTFTVQVDFMADNTWSDYARFVVEPGRSLRHTFPDDYSAHWVRLVSDTDTTATATFVYGPAPGRPTLTDIYVEAGQVTIAFAAGSEGGVNDFTLLGAPVVLGPFTDTGAAISAGVEALRAVVPVTGTAMFYQLQRDRSRRRHSAGSPAWAVGGSSAGPARSSAPTGSKPPGMLRGRMSRWPRESPPPHQ